MPTKMSRPISANALPRSRATALCSHVSCWDRTSIYGAARASFSVLSVVPVGFQIDPQHGTVGNRMTEQEELDQADQITPPMFSDEESMASAQSVLAGLRQQGILADLAGCDGSESVRTMEIPAFNPLTDVSADARHITKTLWIIFVLLPVVVGILFTVFAAAAIFTATSMFAAK